jgi:hypothetical protein
MIKDRIAHPPTERSGAFGGILKSGHIPRPDVPNNVSVQPRGHPPNRLAPRARAKVRVAHCESHRRQASDQRHVARPQFQDWRGEVRPQPRVDPKPVREPPLSELLHVLRPTSRFDERDKPHAVWAAAIPI